MSIVFVHPCKCLFSPVPCSEQIQDALNSDLLPAIEQVNADCVESDAAASETGQGSHGI